jgi:hypothetical protein
MLTRLRIFLPGVVLLGLLASGFAQEATITPNDALILENIPPIPASSLPGPSATRSFARLQCGAGTRNGERS